MKFLKWYWETLKKSLDNTPRCKYCGSTNINLDNASLNSSKKLAAGLVFLPLAFFVGRQPKIAECFDCGRKWKR